MHFSVTYNKKKKQDSKYLGHLATSPPQFEDEEELLARLPVIPLTASVIDAPSNTKTTGIFFFIYSFFFPSMKLTMCKDDAITAELRELYKTFQTCLDLREKYMFKSRQRFVDNPKNQPDWEIYPPPPPPSWPLLSPEQLEKEKAKEKAREADPIAAIGIDFDINCVKLPGSHPVSKFYKKRKNRAISRQFKVKTTVYKVYIWCRCKWFLSSL